jgi:atypical dual specificity phosphatase
MNVLFVLLTMIILSLMYPTPATPCWPCRHQPNEFDLAHNFRWVEHGLLAGMGLPSTREDIEELIKRNVGLIVTLTCDEIIEDTFISGQLNPEILTGLTIQTLYLPIKPHQPPTLDQVSQFITAVESTKTNYRKATVVHCEFGKSRTGTMLACWLIKVKGYTARKAINKIATAASPEQKAFINSYYKYLHHPAATIFPTTPEPHDATMQPVSAEDWDIENSFKAGFKLATPPLMNETVAR